MTRAYRYGAAVLAVLAVLTASAARQQQDKPEEGPAPREEAPLDAAVYDSLRVVINHGADVYNNNDHAGCYRVYEGSLLTVKPLLAHRPALQKDIAKALDAAESDPVVWRRAFTLRAALDKARGELNPKKAKEDREKDQPIEPGPPPKGDKGEQPKEKGPEPDR